MRYFVLALSLATLPVATIAAVNAPASVTAAVAASSRTEDNVKLDESRKPAEILRFLGLRRGMQVLDLLGQLHGHSDVRDRAAVVARDGKPLVRSALSSGGSRFEIMEATIKKWCVGSPVQAVLDATTVLIGAHNDYHDGWLTAPRHLLFAIALWANAPAQ